MYLPNTKDMEIDRLIFTHTPSLLLPHSFPSWLMAILPICCTSPKFGVISEFSLYLLSILMDG